MRCYDQPRAFPSAHARFSYFRSQQANPNPDYAAYDDTEFEVVLMAGLPGAGKDTWIQEHLPNWPMISLDEIRHETGTSPEDEQGRVVQQARERARQFLRMKTPFVWNATNVTRRLRSSLVDLFAAYRARVRIVYVEAPWDCVLQRNRDRASKVPDRVLRSLLDKLEIPACEEAHLIEWVVQH